MMLTSLSAYRVGASVNERINTQTIVIPIGEIEANNLFHSTIDDDFNVSEYLLLPKWRQVLQDILGGLMDVIDAALNILGKGKAAGLWIKLTINSDHSNPLFGKNGISFNEGSSEIIFTKDVMFAYDEESRHEIWISEGKYKIGKNGVADVFFYSPK